IVLITCLISFILMAFSDLVFPILGIMDYPSGIIIITIGMYGMWYAINKHRLISISPKLVSEYIFKAANEPIFILGEDFLIRNCNEALLNITGYKYKDLVKCPFNKIINFRNFNFNTIMSLGNAVNIEVELCRKDKEILACELSSTVIYDEYKDLIGIVILLHDVSLRKNLAEIQKEYTLKLEESNIMLKNQIQERMLAEEKIRHFIYHDTLTEISNRKKMMEDINILLKDEKEKFAIFFIDLDKFKSVNDNYGHKAGDFVLKNAAIRLKGAVRPIDTIGRIGGDEFIIILRQLKNEVDIQSIAVRVLKELNTAFIYNKNQLFIGGSIGISIFPDHGVSADMLISKADLAMYEVKNKGGDGYAIYNDIMNENVINNLEIKKNIKDAINKNEFITYYQPIIDLKSMKILNAESLIRWRRDEKIILPVEFIPIAKEIGEIVEIDNWMLDNACYQCKKWQDSGAKYFGISVNTSYKQLIQFNFVKSVMNILNKYLLEPKYLNLEITEDEAMEDPDVIIKILLELKEQGIRISMDDFGTGYSSLSYINKLPVDIIKIDRSLIVNLGNDSKNLVIIKAIIVMAHSLNIKVVAEGIETEKEFNALSKLECDFIQGYLIGKPLTASDFEGNFIDI
ncbi:MAG: EAL domain-containing protein, partial [Bacillota bacterium]|nr:EAL domain-containing protein [Bacillota bacterium]